MRIAVAGAGNIGGTLARKWAGACHEVRAGVRDPGAARARSLATEAGTMIAAQAMAPAVSGAEIVQVVGLRPVYVGGADQVAVVDGVASLWFALVFGQKQPRHLVFKVLTD